MATTSDNSNPPSPTSESVQSTVVQLHNNGALAGTAVANPNGAWQLTLNNLTEGSHIMTASSGGTVSNEWVVNVQARSGFEDWHDFPAQLLSGYIFYIGKSGLIICPFTATRMEITTVNNSLALTDRANQGTSGYILPTSANRITITIAQPLRPDHPRCELKFISEDTSSTIRSYTGDIGDQTFLFDKPVRFIHWRHYGDTFNLSKISWSND